MIKSQPLSLVVVALAYLVTCAAACGSSSSSSHDAAVAGSQLDQCYAMARATDAGLNDEGKCACDKCLQQLTDCSADPGCLAIRECTQRTGCRGVSDCYLGVGLCRTVIDKYGSTSLSVTLSQQLGDCVMKNMCSPVKEPQCTVAHAFECDGDEDCPSGKQCCGHFDGTGYVGASCGDSCDMMSSSDAAAGGIYSQLCHPGDTCTTDGYSCSESAQYLPTFLLRCRDTGTKPTAPGKSKKAGEVNCGADVCGKGQKCCVREPKAPYCAAASDTCDCAGSDSSAMSGGDAG